MAEKIITLNRPNFLASEVGLRTVTYTFASTFATAVTENGRKIIKAGEKNMKWAIKNKILLLGSNNKTGGKNEMY